MPIPHRQAPGVGDRDRQQLFPGQASPPLGQHLEEFPQRQLGGRSCLAGHLRPPTRLGASPAPGWPITCSASSIPSPCTDSRGSAGHRFAVDGYSAECYSRVVAERGDLLREVMLRTGTTQSELSRVSGVHQPSISQFLSGKVDLSDDQLDRLLSCMGYRLQVVRRPVEPDLTRSERRSWQLHCRLSSQLTRSSLQEWRPTIEGNLTRLRERVAGQPHQRNLGRWTSLVEGGDVLGLHRVLTGLDRESIEMREVSPMGGLLSQDDREGVLAAAR
jgi:transcriptional regulator with XRE-family HTH domain